MRRLRRAHQTKAAKQAKRLKKFKKHALTAGAVAAITFATGLASNKALASDPHQLPVAQDADADLLSNLEEFTIGYRPFRPDQNRNRILDGVELAKRCAAVIKELPSPPQANPGQTYKACVPLDGEEQCDICGASIHMGGCTIINPKLNLRFPDPCDPLDPEFLPDLALHYMEHGSFDCFGHIDSGPWHVGRVDLQRLTRVLELRFPYEPNEHQLPLDYVLESVGQLAPDANDHDGDLMADTEELAARYNLYDPDQNHNLTPDGIELAKQCAAVIDRLPVHDPYSGDPTPTQTYKVCWFQRGLELCDICGAAVNMGYWQVINPTLRLSIDVYDITCHYMSHGSFSYFGLTDVDGEPLNYGRIDLPLLTKVLEMHRRCPHLRTIYRPADLNEDAIVNLRDIVDLADKWLRCTDPNDSRCDQL